MEGLSELDRLAAEQLIAEAERAQEFAKAGGSLGYMEYLKRRKPNTRFAENVVASTLKANDRAEAKASGEPARAAVKEVEVRSGPPEVGGIYDGVVMAVKPFGAFVDFGFDQDGLVHVSKV
jgi:hypothetical protein